MNKIVANVSECDRNVKQKKNSVILYKNQNLSLIQFKNWDNYFAEF